MFSLLINKLNSCSISLCFTSLLLLKLTFTTCQDDKGRAAALEIMIANDAIKNLIRENKGHQIDTMIQTGRNEGMTTLNASLATLVNTGKVNRMVAERYSLDVGELRQLIR